MENSLLLSGGAIAGIVIACVVVLLLIIVAIWAISCRNGIFRLKNTVDEAWATIDVQLKKRYDLIPNLVNTVKGYASHEQQTLDAVISARSAAMAASGDGKIAAENALSGTLKSLFALTESYPNLKADASFLDLQRQLRTVEDELSAARRYYNGTVKEFNTRFDVFPSSLIARHTGLNKRSYFELESAEERTAPTVSF